MKIRVTKKIIKEAYNKIISIPYCDLQYLLNYENPRYYTAGVYGWNADIYEFVFKNERVAIVTGYAPFGNIEPSRELRTKYEKEARKITEQRAEYEKTHKKLERLLLKFLDEALNEKRG